MFFRKSQAKFLAILHPLYQGRNVPAQRCSHRLVFLGKPPRYCWDFSVLFKDPFSPKFLLEGV